MTPSRRENSPRKGDRRSRREQRRDDLSARLGRLPDESNEDYERRLAKQEREAYARSRTRSTQRVKRSKRTLRAPKLSRPKLRKPKLRAPRPTARPSLAGTRAAAAGGLRATAKRAGPAARGAAHQLGAVAAWLLAQLFRLFALAERLLKALLGSLASLISGTVAFLERHATPERVLVLVTGGAATCLVLSQFVAYRGIEVGRPDYTDVANVAPPPQTDRIDAGAAHAYVLVPLAVIALAIAVVALVRGRWRLARLVSLIGAIGVVISLAIDLPKGLDAGTAGVAFAGAKATMTNGFYVQLAASATLVVCGLLLGEYVRRAKHGARRPSARRRARLRRAPSVARGTVARGGA